MTRAISTLCTRSGDGEQTARLVQLAPDSGRVYRIPAGGGVVGRGEEADIRIDGPELSRRHLRLYRDARGQWQIADLASRNGTVVDGTAVSSRGQPLEFGAQLQLGSRTLLFMAHDDTGDKLLELQKMEAVGRLAASVAHDFRNLLGAMRGNLQFASETLGVVARTHAIEQVAEVIESLDETSVAIQRATELTERLLTMARPPAGGEEPVDISALIEEVAGLLRSGHARNVEVRVDVEGELMVRGERGRLHQMLMNLGVNGCDAMPEGGTLTFEARPSTTKPSLTVGVGPCIELRVADTGQGIDEASRPRIFEPFFSTKGDKGTGLGLATVYSVVRHHGGEINVQSAPGEGTTFTLLLPIGEREHARLETLSKRPSVEVPLQTGRGVLVVDDEPMVLSASKRLLESWGYVVHTAEGGADAVRLFEELHSELGLVVVDVQMPGLDGPALLRILRMIEPGLRAVVTSARVDVETVRAELGSGDVFIPKPHGDALRAVLEDMIG